ncbi:MICOS complex subunit MIC19 [Bienertia sinuspersici]
MSLTHSSQMATQNDPMSQSLSKMNEMFESFNAKMSVLEKATQNKIKDIENMGFGTPMSISGIDPILSPKIFPLSLDQVCQKWFFSLDDKDTATWEDITHSFMTRYKGNTQMSTSLRELEILSQKEREGFTAYLARWKGIATQLITTPPEKEMVKIFLSNLLPNKSVLEPIGPTPDPVPDRRTKWWNPNKYCRYHQGNGHSTKKCFKLKDCIEDMVDNGCFPTSSGCKKSNIQTNPLSILLIDDGECYFDPTSYITPVGQPMPLIITPPDHNQINGIWDDKETSAQDD